MTEGACYIFPRVGLWVTQCTDGEIEKQSFSDLMYVIKKPG